MHSGVKFLFQQSLREHDSAIKSLFTEAHVSFLAGAALSGVAAGEASGSPLIGIATGVAVEAIGYGRVRIGQAAWMASERASFATLTQSVEDTDRIVAAIQESENSGPDSLPEPAQP